MPAVMLGGVFAIVLGALVLAAQGETMWVPPRDIAVAMTMGAVLLAIGMVSIHAWAAGSFRRQN